MDPSCFGLKIRLLFPIPREYQFYVSVVDSSFPLTHYTITNRNSDLELVVSGETYNINLSLGNYNLDEIKLYMNDRLPHGFVVSYSENTNKLKISTTQPNTNLEIGVGTTCCEILGFVVGDCFENGVYEIRKA